MPNKGKCKICGEETDIYWKTLCFKHWKEKNTSNNFTNKNKVKSKTSGIEYAFYLKDNKWKIPYETALANLDRMGENDHFKEIAKFIYYSDCSVEELFENLAKYKSYDSWKDSLGGVARFFKTEKEPSGAQKKIYKPKKYTTYSAHGHFETNNPISALLNYIAILPAYILGIVIAGIAMLLVSIGKLFGLKDDFKK